jgi:hypothetical protein
MDADSALFISDLQDAKKNSLSKILAVLGIQIRMFLGLPDPAPDQLVRGTDPDSAPDQLVRGTDPDSAPDPSFAHKCVDRTELIRKEVGSVQINYGSGCGSRRPKNIRIQDPDPETLISASRDKKCATEPE